ncbi:MAG TPA: DUF2628 domain-containing protein, partial [Gammaproteobacteria bacterium]|nr:DUF2628 domain-containing protein [Gammaproteobacteria bacterium]
MTEQINIDKELYSAVVGPEKSAYYLSKFERFASTGSRASWNWPVFFISFFWLLYRKMWLWAVCYFLLPYPVFIVLSIVSAFTTPWVLTVGLVLYWVVIWFVLPIYANALYYRHVRAKVNLASQSFSTTEKS